MLNRDIFILYLNIILEVLELFSCMVVALFIYVLLSLYILTLLYFYPLYVYLTYTNLYFMYYRNDVRVSSYNFSTICASITFIVEEAVCWHLMS